jgi:hypothetical protein
MVARPILGSQRHTDRRERSDYVMKSTAALVVFSLIVAACGASTNPQGTGTQPAATATPAGATPGTTAGGGGTAGAGTVTMHLEVQSGPKAGTYDKTGSNPDCKVFSGGSAANWVDPALDAGQKVDGLYEMLIGSSVNGPSPAQFSFQANLDWDPVNDPAGFKTTALEILIVTGTTVGSGTMQLEDLGATIKMTVQGTSESGIGLRATIECGPVARF